MGVNFSVTIYHTHLIFSVILLDRIRERLVSQIFFNSLVFILCNVKYIVENKYQIRFLFSIIKKKLGPKIPLNKMT